MNLTEPRELAPLLEAFLLASGKPQSLERLFELFEEGERPEPPVFKKALELLRKSCDGRAFELKEVASGYRLQIREKYSPWVGRLWEERPQRYSRAMLETMALIAYRQPITRGEIEEDEGDPRAELIRRLQQYERFKAAAEGIEGLSRVGREIFVPKLDAPEARARKLVPDVALEELLMSMAEVLRRTDMFESHQVSREALSTRERMSDVLERLKGGGFVPFIELFTAEEGKLGVVVTFMAILELVKESLIELVQNEPFAPIHVRARAE